MVGKREAKRTALKNALIEAAQNRIDKSGIHSLRARDIAQDAGCALGSLYTAFQDIDDLVLNVNAQTLRALGEQLASAVKSANTPSARLLALAKAYLAFAKNEHNMWSAVFEHALPEGTPIPNWYMNEQKVLFEHITQPLAELCPTLNDREAAIQARVLFTAVHGIVVINLQHRFTRIPHAELDKELQRFVETYIKGLK